MSRGPVLVAQPVHQHAYETALAMQEAGLLHAFATGLYDTGRGLARLARLVPGAERELARRRHPLLDPARVTTISRYHVAATGLRRLSGRPLLDTWAHEHFAGELARRLPRLAGLRAVHCFEGASREVFEAAARLGALRVLDTPSTAERFEREARREGVAVQTIPWQRIHAERRLADLILVPAESAATCLIEAGCPPERVVVVPFGVDPDRFAPAGGRREGPFRALFVGRVGAMKGVPALLEAWRRLALRDAELVLVGPLDVDGAALLRRYAGVARWVPPVPKHEVDRFYRESDLFVFPSLAEGSAYVTYEALASGLPLLATRASGSVMRDGEHGFVVEPRDPDALAERILWLRDHAKERTALGRAARAHVLDAYTWRHYRARVGALYRALLAGEPPTGAEAAA